MNTALYPRKELTLWVDSQKGRLGSYYRDFSPNYFEYKLRWVCIFWAALWFGLVAGLAEAVAGGKALKQAGYQFDAAHTSALQRAQVSSTKRAYAVKCRVYIPF